MHGDFVRFVRVLIVAQVSNQRQEVGFNLTLIAFSVSDRAGASNSRSGAVSPPCVVCNHDAVHGRHIRATPYSEIACPCSSPRRSDIIIPL